MRRRERRDLAQLNVSIPRELVDSLRDKARLEGRAVADIVEQLVYDYVNNAPREPSEPRLVSIDLMIDDNTESTLSIISHQCLELAEKPLSENDKTAVAEFVAEHGEFPVAAVRAGIAMSLLRTKHRKINGVRYFFPEILACRDAGADANFAEYRAMQWKRERKIREGAK